MTATLTLLATLAFALFAAALPWLGLAALGLFYGVVRWG